MIARLLMVGAATLAMASPAVADPALRIEQQARTGSMPWSVTVSPDGDDLYVSHVGLRDRDNVWRYDAASLEITGKAHLVGHAVESIPRGDSLFVSDSREDFIFVVAPHTMEVQRKFGTRRIPKDFELSPDGATVYVAHWGAGGVGAYDARTGAELGFTRTGRHARGIALSPNGTTAYVMNFGAGTVSVVDTGSLAVTRRIRACKNPRHAVFTPDGARALVTCFGDGRVVVLDTDTHEITRRVRVGRAPKTIALSRDGRYAYVANEKSDSLTAIDLETWDSSSLALPVDQPIGIAVSPDDRTLYVTARGSNELLALRRTDDAVVRRE